MSESRPTFSLVVGVDFKHLRQLALTWPTWKRHKSEMLEWPMIVFYDYQQVEENDIRGVVDHPNLRCVAWPFSGTDQVYPGDGTCKWDSPQRYRMLAGFVYVPAACVTTQYWLKLDTDVLATDQEDWIKSKWFEDNPSIVAHRWGFTKPANQMQKLDEWASKLNGISPMFEGFKPLELRGEPGASKIGHKRIISWGAFFEAAFSRFVASLASRSCGIGFLPVPSQDGYVWYCAKRMGRGIVRTNMKSRGWKHCSNERNIQKAIREMSNG